MKRVGIVLLQLLVTGAGLWYVFHDQKSEQRSRMLCDMPIEPGYYSVGFPIAWSK